MLKAVCARDEGKAKAFANQWGYESVETDWKKLLERKDIDAVDICTPNNLHKEIALAAAAAARPERPEAEGDRRRLLGQHPGRRRRRGREQHAGRGCRDRGRARARGRRADRVDHARA